MNRRAARSLAPILLISMIVIAVTFGSPSAHAAASWRPSSASAFAVVATRTATAPEPPPITANDFLPEERNLSDCVGVLERPGCGSESRGGPMMNVVFVMVMIGMAFIFWRIIVGVRKNRAGLERARSIES